MPVDEKEFVGKRQKVPWTNEEGWKDRMGKEAERERDRIKPTAWAETIIDWITRLSSRLAVR